METNTTICQSITMSIRANISPTYPPGKCIG